MAKLPAGTNKTSYVTDKKTGKAAIVNPKKVQEAGVGSIGKMAVKLGVKAVQKVVKSATASPKVKAEAKALKAAKGPSLASKAKKLEAVSGKVQRAQTKMKAETNLILGQSKKEAFGNAAKAMDKQSAKNIERLEIGRARDKAQAKATKIAKALKNTK